MAIRSNWPVVPESANPVFEVGISIAGPGSVYLDWLTWEGTPDVILTKPPHKGTMWRRAWINAVDSYLSWGEPFRLVQNDGVGLLMQGTRDWQDYKVSADVTPHLAKRVGIAARVQGLKRYYALELTREDTVQIVEMLDTETILAEQQFEWSLGDTIQLSLEVHGNQLTGKVNGTTRIEATSNTLLEGSIALLIEEGRTATHAVRIQPVDQS